MEHLVRINKRTRKETKEWGAYIAEQGARDKLVARIVKAVWKKIKVRTGKQFQQNLNWI
jgi:hypothetical protein